MENSFIKEESKGFESNGDEESCVEEVVLQVQKRVQDDDEMKTASPNLKNFINCNSRRLYDQLGSSKAELNDAMEENQRLKMHLDRVLEDYRTLEKQYQDTIQDQETKESSNGLPTPVELISLSLGISCPSEQTKVEQHRTTQRNENADVNEGGDKEGLTLGLDCKTFRVAPQKLSAENIYRPENSLDEGKEEGGETRLGNDKGKSNVKEAGNDEITQQNPAKRARVSVRVRCDTPTMNDGCQWRKYGQKIAKGNPCPRAYYRCTVAPSCPVRKQVQRYVEDMSILITTYEGTHNHPLPISATAMASTTSAAASMLTSGSSNSSTGPGPSSSVPVFENLNGLNFYPSHENSRLKPFYLPNSSISSTSSYPTITLDLTTSATSSSSMSSHLTQLTNFPPKYSTTNLNFSSLESSTFPNLWTSGPYQTTRTNSFSFGTQPYETLHQTYSQKANNASHGQQNVTPEAIAAATKAITADPVFRSALVEALSSIIGSNGTSAATMLQNQSEGDKSSRFKNVEIGEPNFPILSSFTSQASNVNKSGPSFLNTSSSN